MNSRKKFFFVFCFIIINFILLLSFLVIRDATSYNSLKKEVDKILLLDIMKDKYDTKIVCSGKYGVVEKNIKIVVQFLFIYSIIFMYRLTERRNGRNFL